jgi:hypothetical protein
VFNALSDMDRAGLIDLRKVFDMLKTKYGVTLLDTVDSIMRYNPHKEEMKGTETNEIRETSTTRKEEETT